MTQTVPATCVLGPGKTGLAIGLRVLNLDGTTYSAFATTDVAETSTLGTYRKSGGAVVPDAGGYIVWGTAVLDLAEDAIKATAVNVTTWKGLVPSDLYGGKVSAYLDDTRISGYVGVGLSAEAMFFDGSMPASCIGQRDIFYSPITYDNQYQNWTFIVEDGNSGIMFATRVASSTASTQELHLSDPVPSPGYAVTDPIMFLLLPHLSPLMQQDIPTAIGLAAANLDTQLAALPTDQDVRDAMKLAPSAGAPAAGSVDAHLDDLLTTIGSEIVEGTYTRDDILRIIAAALAGETSGSGTPTVTITGLDGVTTRITATLDGGGNRTAMTLDGEV